MLYFAVCVVKENAAGVCATKSHFVEVLKGLPESRVKTELSSDVDGYYEEWCG